MLTLCIQFVSCSVRRAMRLMLTACCCLAFAALIQAQSSSYEFVVLGTSGPNWVDTGLDLPPNTVLQLRATGEVDVSAGWGRHRAEGTPRSNCARVSGYPVGEPYNCYGLVARLTTDTTLPTPSSPGVLAVWPYGESEGYFAAPQGGHLWLTVNDDNPGDNSGFFKVHVQVTTFPLPEILCQRCPWHFPTKSDLRGEYPDPKAMRGILALGGRIIEISQSGKTTLVFVSQGTVVAKYGDLPSLKVIFQKEAVRQSLSKASVIQGFLLQNNKMSLITGAAPLGAYENTPEN